MRNICVIGLAGLFGALAAAPAQAQWGSMKGKVILEDAVPEVKLLVRKGDKNAKDPEVCAAQDIPDESLAIDAQSKGIANVAIWLVKKPAKIHPKLEKPAQAELLFDQVGCRFIPHVLIVHNSQTVKLVSGDAVAHNTRASPLKNQGFNIIVPPKDRKGTLETMKQAERLPVQIGCDIHNWMRAYWVVVDHPYAAVTDKDGVFEINDLPAGEHEFRVWHETPGYVVKSLKVAIRDGATHEVPDIKVSLKTLTEKK